MPVPARARRRGVARSIVPRDHEPTKSANGDVVLVEAISADGRRIGLCAGPVADVVLVRPVVHPSRNLQAGAAALAAHPAIAETGTPAPAWHRAAAAGGRAAGGIHA